MATATITTSGTVSGLSAGSKTITFTITSNSAVGEYRTITLAAADNAVAVPTGTSAVVIFPAAGNVATLKITSSGATATNFLQIHKTNPTMVSWDSGAGATLTVNSSGIVACDFSFF